MSLIGYFIRFWRHGGECKHIFIAFANYNLLFFYVLFRYNQGGRNKKERETREMENSLNFEDWLNDCHLLGLSEEIVVYCEVFFYLPYQWGKEKR